MQKKKKMTIVKLLSSYVHRFSLFVFHNSNLIIELTKCLRIELPSVQWYKNNLYFLQESLVLPNSEAEYNFDNLEENLCKYSSIYILYTPFFYKTNLSMKVDFVS